MWGEDAPRIGRAVGLKRAECTAWFQGQKLADGRPTVKAFGLSSRGSLFACRAARSLRILSGRINRAQARRPCFHRFECMSRSSLPKANRREIVRLRGLISLAVSLLVVLALFKFWPMPTVGNDTSGRFADVRPQEVIELELIERTDQNQTIPSTPPPPPQEVFLPPIEVPDERIIEERVRELEMSLPSPNSVPSAPPSPPPGPVGPPQPPPTSPPPQPTLVRSPDRSPVPVRFSEPAYPQAARDDGVRARVRIEVLVDELGRVQETRIIERVRIGRGDREEHVDSLPYGIDQSALDAAQRYQFRPARHEGRAVQSYTIITCNFGL